MKINFSNNAKGLFILAIVIGMLICWIMILSDMPGFNLALPSDLSLSKTYLCKNIGEECLVLNNNVFSGKDFATIKVCTNYISSKPIKLQLFLVYQEGGPFIGMLFDNLDEGDYEVCYFLHEVVERMESTNLGGRNPSPVHDGMIDQGSYRIVFEKGRITLAELEFEVVEDN